jgi:DNA-directed RNA polymerase subunit RPC12/RpoP
MPDVITGLTCPNCAGTLSVQEGQRIVKCPYCEARSLVRGERGVRRYQVERRVDRDAAAQSVRGFWSGLNRAMDLARTAQLSELFLVYLPYWRVQALMAGWVFGKKKVRRGESTRWEPREVQIMDPVGWTGAAGDVAEFGVTSLPLDGIQFAAYDPEALHSEGLVFEPTGSQTAVTDSARQDWLKQASRKARLDNVTQTALQFFRHGLALVYYPLWVARYHYRNRSYQVVVDGFNGRVLYGKAPGNVAYRALMLVAGTALGTFVCVNGSALALFLVGQSSDGDSLFLLVLPLLAGAGLVAAGYRLFRWGEEIEHRLKVRQ